MEVHAHTHTSDPDSHRGRLKWIHYFWEFFMLFLAVTLGFVVENWREHYVERHREQEYLVSMINDLEKDTTEFTRQINDVHYGLTQLDTLISLLELSERTESQQRRLYYLGRTSSRILAFYYLHDQTHEQMKSSGNLRLFHDH